MAEIPQNQFAVGKGLAQVLGTNNPNAVLDAIARNKASKAKKPIEYDEWTPDKDPTDYYAPQGIDIFNEVRDYSVQFISKNPGATKFDLQKDPTYRGLTNKYYTLVGSSLKVGAAQKASSDWSQDDVNEDFVAKRRKELMTQSPNDANIEQFEATPFHPNYHDPNSALTNWAKDISMQLKDENTEEKNGVINIDGESARFGWRDEDGAVVAGISDDLIEQALAANVSADRAFRWQIAQDMASDRDNEEEVDAIYQRIKDDASFTEKVYDKARKTFEQLQKVATKNSKRNVKKSRKEDYGDDIEIIIDDKESLKRSEGEASGGTLGYTNIRAETPKLVPSMVYDNDGPSENLIRFKTNNNGETAIVTQATGGELKERVLTIELKNKLINSHVFNEDRRNGTKRFIKRFEDKFEESKKRIGFEADKFNTLSSDLGDAFENIDWNMFGFDKTVAKNDAVLTDVKEIIKSAGINDEVKIDPKVTKWGNSYLIIGDKRFNLETDAGKQKLKDYLFESHQETFRNESEKQVKNSPKTADEI